MLRMFVGGGRCFEQYVVQCNSGNNVARIRECCGVHRIVVICGATCCMSVYSASVTMRGIIMQKLSRNWVC